MKKVIIYIVVIIIGAFAFHWFTSSIANQDDTVNNIPSSFQGVYQNYNRGGTNNLCSTTGLKIEQTTAKSSFKYGGNVCAKATDFNSDSSKTYSIRNIKWDSSNSERITFDLYLGDVKKYECYRTGFAADLLCKYENGVMYEFERLD